MPPRHGSSAMPPPSGPPPNRPKRSNRERAQSAARAPRPSTFQAVVIDVSPSHSSSPRSSLKRRSSDSRLSQSTSAKRSSRRSEGSSLATVFSGPTRKDIIRLGGYQCWHCESEDDLECAHIIGKAKKIILRDLQKSRLTNLKSLSETANGMHLCINCHHAFDSSEYPAWVFIPSDLDFFITHERADLTRREHEYQTTGVWPVRECPPIEEYVEEAGGLYDAYMLRNYGHKTSGWRPGRSTLLPHSKKWHGDPMSTLFKGFNSSGRHSLFLPSKLRILDEMYQRNDLGPRSRATSTNRDNHDGSQGDDYGNGRGNEPLDLSTSTATPIKSSPLAKDPATQRSETSMNEPLAGGYGIAQNRGQKRSHAREEEDPEPKRVKVEMSPWAWGPHKTSSDRAEYYKVKMKAMEGWARLRDTSKERIKHAPAHLPSPEPSEKESKNNGHEWSGSRRVLKWLSETKQADTEMDCKGTGKKRDNPVDYTND